MRRNRLNGSTSDRITCGIRSTLYGYPRAFRETMGVREYWSDTHSSSKTHLISRIGRRISTSWTEENTIIFSFRVIDHFYWAEWISKKENVQGVAEKSEVPIVEGARENIYLHISVNFHQIKQLCGNIFLFSLDILITKQFLMIQWCQSWKLNSTIPHALLISCVHRVEMSVTVAARWRIKFSISETH